MGLPSHLALLAEACLLGRRPEDGLRAVEEALQIVRDTGECAYEADLHRLKGDLLCQTTKGAARKAGLETRAEASYREAVAIARRQGARSFELRAILGLCHLRRAPRKRTENGQALEKMHTAFSEGFETADLLAARALPDD